LGLSYFEKEQYQDAINSFKTAITHARSEPESTQKRENLSFYNNNKGLALYHDKKFPDAMEAYDEAIALNELNAENYFNRGNVRLN
jgi:tetratricopeptide (TPR) repeat protein